MSKQAVVTEQYPTPATLSSISGIPSLVGKKWNLHISYEQSSLPVELQSFQIDFQEPDPTIQDVQRIGGTVDGLSATYALLDGQITLDAANQPCLSFKIYMGNVTYSFTPARLLATGAIAPAPLTPSLNGGPLDGDDDPDASDDPTWSAQAQPHFP